MLLWTPRPIYIYTERYQQRLPIGLLRNVLKNTRNLIKSIERSTCGAFLAAALWLILLLLSIAEVD